MNEIEKVLITKSSMDAIGDAIRDRNGLLTTYLPSEMAAAIESIPNNYTLADESKVVKNGALVAQTARATVITENGTYDTTENNSVTVNVSGSTGTIEYTPTAGPSNISSLNDTVIIKTGNICSINACVNFSTANSSRIVLMTIPEAVRPTGYVRFFGSNGANTADRTGHIDQNGEIVLESGAWLSYIYFYAEWFVGQTQEITYDSSIINSLVGGLAIADSCADLSCQINLKSLSSGWYRNIITIPAIAIPETYSRPRATYANGYTADTLFGNGAIDMYLNINRGTTVYLHARWKI